MEPTDRRPIITYAVLLGVGVALGGVQLAAGGEDAVGPQGVATANSVHVALAVVTLAALAVARHRDRDRLRAFLRRPFTATGWRDLTGALLWRTKGVRPLRFLAAAVMLYTPLRAGVQVLAGLDPDFTRTAWGGPTYAGAMAAHYLDGALMFFAAAAVVAARRTREPVGAPR
jgi:hypothetical protein